MSIWTVAKMAASKVPWGQVMRNLPGMVEMANRAKGRLLGEGSSGDLRARVQELEEENRRLEKALLETSGHLQLATKTLRVVLARQKVLMAATAVSLVLAAVALAVALR